MFNTVKKLANSVARNWTRPQMVRVNRRPKLVPVTKPAPVIDFDALREAVAEAELALIDSATKLNICTLDGREQLIDAAKRLGLPEVAEFNETQLQAFATAICEDEDGTAPLLKEIIIAVYAIMRDRYTHYLHICDRSELGYKLIEEAMPTEYIPGFLWDFIAQGDLGEWWANEYCGRFSNHGYFQPDEIEMIF